MRTALLVGVRPAVSLSQPLVKPSVTNSPIASMSDWGGWNGSRCSACLIIIRNFMIPVSYRYGNVFTRLRLRARGPHPTGVSTRLPSYTRRAKERQIDNCEKHTEARRNGVFDLQCCPLGELVTGCIGARVADQKLYGARLQFNQPTRSQRLPAMSRKTATLP